MDWTDVSLFLAVADRGSLRAASRQLAIDASTLSRRLAALESSLGVRLFERRPAGLQLTAAGEDMLQVAQRVHADMEGLGRRISARDVRMAGTVRLTFPGAFVELVNRALVHFWESHPEIEIEIDTQDRMLDLGARQADVAIRVADAPPDHLIGRRLALLAGAVYASRDYREKHLGPLHEPEHRWVDWDRSVSAKPILRWVQEHYPERRVVLRGATTLDVLFAVRAGTGVGLLPCLVGDAELALERLSDAPSDTWPSVWLLTHRDVQPTARVRVLMDWLADALQREKSAIEGRPLPRISDHGSDMRASARTSYARGGPSKLHVARR